MDVRGELIEQRTRLLSLLRQLDPAGWNHTATGDWTVKDVALHLLG